MAMSDMFKKALNNTREILIQVDEDRTQDRIEYETTSQKQRDILAATKAFIELKADDKQLYSLLNRYFRVNSISEAEEYINKAKAHWQIVKLREYCINHGMAEKDFRPYCEQHQVEKSN